MQLKQARLIMEAAEAKSKAAAATTTVLPESEGKADDGEWWDESDFENALKLIRSMAFQLHDTAKLVVMHPHRRTALEALANDGLQFICMFETDDDNNSSVDEANNCKLCKAPPYGGACTGECMDV